MGLCGCLPIFIGDLLTDRYFKFRVGNRYSDHYSQEAGVTQGSILSVMLFRLKINSIVSCLLIHSGSPKVAIIRVKA